MIKITYLDEDAQPTTKDQAVVIEHTEYDESGKPVQSHYVEVKKDTKV